MNTIKQWFLKCKRWCSISTPAIKKKHALVMIALWSLAFAMNLFNILTTITILPVWWTIISVLVCIMCGIGIYCWICVYLQPKPTERILYETYNYADGYYKKDSSIKSLPTLKARMEHKTQFKAERNVEDLDWIKPWMTPLGDSIHPKAGEILKVEKPTSRVETVWSTLSWNITTTNKI